jgi:putative membrane protein
VSESSLIRRIQFAVVSAVILRAMPALAGEPVLTVNVTLKDWSWPPFVVIPLLLTAAVYSIGVVKMLRRRHAATVFVRPILWFALGWISLVIALDSPLHELGEQLFWAHMTQHEILMLVSAPLLVLGRPLVPFLWALSPAWRDRAAGIGRLQAVKTIWSTLSAPLSAWLLSALALWVWHLPSLFDQTLKNDWIHAAQHTTFLVTALVFWWPLVNRTPLFGYGGSVVYVFTTILHTSLLGALLTFAPRPWYSSYARTAPAWHLTALEDQQLGGLIMWIPAGTLLLIVALALLVKWIRESETRWQYTRLAELGRVPGGVK